MTCRGRYKETVGKMHAIASTFFFKSFSLCNIQVQFNCQSSGKRQTAISKISERAVEHFNFFCQYLCVSRAAYEIDILRLVSKNMQTSDDHSRNWMPAPAVFVIEICLQQSLTVWESEAVRVSDIQIQSKTTWNQQVITKRLKCNIT